MRACERVSVHVGASVRMSVGVRVRVSVSCQRSSNALLTGPPSNLVEHGQHEIEEFVLRVICFFSRQPCAAGALRGRERERRQAMG